jgi:hypothetical protein
VGDLAKGLNLDPESVSTGLIQLAKTGEIKRHHTATTPCNQRDPGTSAHSVAHAESWQCPPASVRYDLQTTEVRRTRGTDQRDGRPSLSPTAAGVTSRCVGSVRVGSEVLVSAGPPGWWLTSVWF